MSNTPRELAQIFDLTWSEFLRIEGTENATEDNRKLLAARIVTIERSGEYDGEAISDAALIYMRALKAARELSVSPSNVLAFPSRSASASFGPERVKAMAAALELCLNELPLRVPSDARDTLTSAILRAASEGETDALKMMDAGMRALSARNVSHKT